MAEKKSPIQKPLQQIAGMTATDALAEIALIRNTFIRLRNERLSNPNVSEETKKHAREYWGSKIDALNIAAAAIVKAHKLKVDKRA
jgi:hypothetical protein